MVTEYLQSVCACGTPLNSLRATITEYRGKGKNRKLYHEQICFGCAKRRGLLFTEKKSVKPSEIPL